MALPRAASPVSPPAGAANADEAGHAGDASLLQRIAAGDLSALGTLYDRHHAAVRQFLRRAAPSSADADDLTHETFLALAKISGRYDGRASARPLLIGVAAQLARRHRRGFARWAEALASFTRLSAAATHATPEDNASVTEDIRRLDAALATLSEEKRLVFLMVDGEGLSGAEVAEALDIPVNTVWTRLHYARSEIRAARAYR